MCERARWRMMMSIQIDRAHNPNPTVQRAHDRQSQLEQALKRSVTLVIWYRPNGDPIRLTHEISTFPFFSLSHYPTVVSDLELTPSSYIDAYNSATGHWEQHMITTVRTIESEQRLLYKLRKSLLTGLSDDECAGLADELVLQAKKKKSSPTQLKRPLPDGAPGEVPNPKRFYFPDSSYPAHVYIPPPISYMLPTQTIPYAPPLPSPPLSTTHSPGRNSTESAEMSSPFQGTTSTVPVQSSAVAGTPLYASNTATRAPQHPHPPLKRWPNDHTVFEIAEGFRAMDALVAQSPTVTQKAAFERVFGCRYVKSTVCRHRGVYRKADPAVRAMFEAMGSDERAVWGEFVRRVEGRPAVGKGSASGDEKAQDDAGVVGKSGQEQAGQTGSDQMIASMSHLTMRPGECGPGDAPR